MTVDGVIDVGEWYVADGEHDRAGKDQLGHNLILVPYGYTCTDLPSDMTPIDRQTFVAMGAEMERTSTAGYHSQQSSDLCITDGDWNDWMYGAMHRYRITIELSGGTFYPPDEIIPRESARNHQAAIFVARWPTAPRGSRSRNPPRDRSCPPTFRPASDGIWPSRPLW